MYVYDMNLMHLLDSSGSDSKEFVAHVQEATTDYGYLVQASGGILEIK
jgi:hypothetical protein